jgi:hypothetical protein
VRNAIGGITVVVVVRTLAAVTVALAVGVGSAGAAAKSRLLVSYGFSGGLTAKQDWMRVARDGSVQSSEDSFRLSARRLVTLQRALRNARFATLRTEYLPPDPVADGYTSSVTYGGRTVAVAENATAPLRLQRVLALLAAILADRG